MDQVKALLITETEKIMQQCTAQIDNRFAALNAEIAKTVSETVNASITSYTENITQRLNQLPAVQDMIELKQIMHNMQGQFAISQSSSGSHQGFNPSHLQVDPTQNRGVGGNQ